MKMTDRVIEEDVRVLLKAGVLISGVTTLTGGILFLIRHGGDPVSYEIFHSQPRIDRIIPEILAGAWKLRARSIIQLGILLLIATPVGRNYRDRACPLLYSLISGCRCKLKQEARDVRMSLASSTDCPVVERVMGCAR